MTLQEKIAANSAAWHTAQTQEEKDRLHNENIQYHKQLDEANHTQSTFNPGDGKWSTTGGYTPPPTTQRPSVTNDNSDYLAELFAAQKKAALSQLQSAYDKNVSSIDRAQEGIAPAYQDARNQAAGQSAQAKRSFAEFAAASGLNSGAGGQAELAQNVTLQNNLSEINASESAKLADLQLKRTDAESDYNNAIAQANATGDFELAKSLYQEKIRVDEAWTEQIRYETQQEQLAWEKQHTLDREGVSDSHYLDSLKQQEWENKHTVDRDTTSDNRYLDQQKQLELENAYRAANDGDFSKLDGMGVDTSLLKAQFAAAAQAPQQPPAPAHKSGAAPKTGITAQQALSAFKSGLDTPEIRAAILPVYGNIFDDPKDGTEEGENDPPMGNQTLPFGDAARAIARQLSNPFIKSSLKPGIIETAYKAQKISKAEADKLLKSIGA